MEVGGGMLVRLCGWIRGDVWVSGSMVVMSGGVDMLRCGYVEVCGTLIC